MADITKGFIGKEDFVLQSNTDAPEQFERGTSVGGTMDLYKMPDFWTYTGALRPADIFTKNPWYEARIHCAADGVTNDRDNVSEADTAAAGKLLMFGPGTYLLNTGVTITSPFIQMPEASFSGAGALSFSEGIVLSATNYAPGGFPLFGNVAFDTISYGATRNAILGRAYNNGAAATTGYPTGVTGVGIVAAASTGNCAFGIYGRVELYDAGTVTNEMNSMNYVSPTSSLPPDRSIGTSEAHSIAMTMAAGGDYNSSIGIHFTPEGSAPQRFLTGIYFNSDSIATTGTAIIVGATATDGPLYSMNLQNKGDGANLRLQTLGAEQGTNAVIWYTNAASESPFIVRQNGGIECGDIQPWENDTYYLGKNSAVSPRAWKGVIMRNTDASGYYRLEIGTGGTVNATAL